MNDLCVFMDIDINIYMYIDIHIYIYACMYIMPVYIHTDPYINIHI